MAHQKKVKKVKGFPKFTNKDHTKQFQSCLCRSPGGRSEVKSGVLIMVILCCVCMAGLITVVHSTLPFPFCPKVTVCPHITPPGVFYSFPAYVADIFRVAGRCFSALYPEMVDALIFLDAYGFLPTDLSALLKVMRQGIDEMLQFETKTEEKRRVYTYEKAVERSLAANPTLSKESVNILLKRVLVQVEGAGFVFSRDLRVNFKNTVHISVEQSLEMQSRLQASVLVVL
ncbi:serine hydrolase-like protein [Scomber japonicus]|uniref:serine hydrolase-like protein n=1 Tax=Scomber japonicus TaxID=13676 RepID=UPI00230670BD|nr:serine hydrolase-like protein [Scomber japonicus]